MLRLQCKRKESGTLNKMPSKERMRMAKMQSNISHMLITDGTTEMGNYVASAERLG